MTTGVTISVTTSVTSTWNLAMTTGVTFFAMLVTTGVTRFQQIEVTTGVTFIRADTRQAEDDCPGLDRLLRLRRKTPAAIEGDDAELFILLEMANDAALAAPASQVRELGIGSFDLAAVVEDGEGECCQRVDAGAGIMNDAECHGVPSVKCLPVGRTIGRPDQPAAGDTVELPAAELRPPLLPVIGVGAVALHTITGRARRRRRPARRVALSTCRQNDRLA